MHNSQGDIAPTSGGVEYYSYGPNIRVWNHETGHVMNYVAAGFGSQNRFAGDLGLSVRFPLVAFAVVMLVLAAGCDTTIHDRATPDQMALFLVSETKTAQEKFYSKFHRYGTFEELSAQSERLMSITLAGGSYYRYRFELAVDAARYSLTAVPEHRGDAMERSFYCDQTGVVRQSWGPAPATARSPGVK